MYYVKSSCHVEYVECKTDKSAIIIVLYGALLKSTLADCMQTSG